MHVIVNICHTTNSWHVDKSLYSGYYTLFLICNIWTGIIMPLFLHLRCQNYLNDYSITSEGFAKKKIKKGKRVEFVTWSGILLCAMNLPCHASQWMFTKMCLTMLLAIFPFSLISEELVLIHVHAMPCNSQCQLSA